MSKRILTALIALVLFIPLFIFGSWPLELLVGLVALFALMEFVQMEKMSIRSFPAILSGLIVLSMALSPRVNELFSGDILMPVIILQGLILLVYSVWNPDLKIKQIGSVLLMTVYIGVGTASLVSLRQYSLTFVLLVLLVIWATDTGAYLIGGKIGKTKLAPSISPNKTIEGSAGGTIASAIVSAIYLIYFPIADSYILSILFMMVLSVVGQLGDLVESKIKREYGVKDSGKILPGHGGILDRIDSLLLVLNVLFVIGLLR